MKKTKNKITNPKPLHPGQVLSEVYMNEMNLNQTQFADLCGCSHRKINEIVNGKRSITPLFAIELEAVLGTTPMMWLKIQAEYDLHKARFLLAA